MAWLAALGIALLVLVNTVVTVVATRFFRLQLETWWAVAIYTGLFVPVVLLVTTFVVTGALQVGGATGDTSVAIVLAVLLPLATGVAIDVFWMPAPEEVELPETA